MMDYVKAESEGKYIIGHNSLAADAVWTDKWAERSGVKMPDFTNKSIDTMEAARIAWPGRSSNELGTLANDLNIDIKGSAHLADVDIATTTKLAEVLANSEDMKPMLDNMSKPLTEGDIFIKIGQDERGLIGLEKGVYEFTGIKASKDIDVNGNQAGVSHSVGFKNLLDDVEGSFSAPNTASIQREASNNWIRFDDKESALAYHENLTLNESNRTLENAITKGDAWDLYKTRGSDGGTQPIIDRLTALKGSYEQAQDNGIMNLGGSKKWNNTNIPDDQKLAIANMSKLEGSGFDYEIARLSKEVSPRRMKEFQAVSKYANTEEGLLVDDFLKKGRDRLQAGVVGKDDYNAFSKDIFKSIKAVKEKGIESGILDSKAFKFTTPNAFNFGEVTGEKLVSGEFMGGQYGLKNIDPFNLNIDFSNRTSIEQSMWKSVNKLAKVIVKAPGNKKMEINQAKNIALNQFIMPIIGEKIDDKGLVEAIKINKSNYTSVPGTPKDYADSFNTNTLPGVADHLMKNKEKYMDNLAPIEEINTLMPMQDKALLGELEESFNTNLKSLDLKASTVNSLDSEGKFISEPSPMVHAMNEKLVELQEVDRMESNKIINKLMGGSADDVLPKNDMLIPFLSTKYNSKASMKATEDIMNVAEINLINPMSDHPELAIQTAAELKDNADKIFTDRKIMSPGEFNHMIGNKAHPEQKAQAHAAMPEYTDYLREGSLNRDVSHIENINKSIKDMSNKIERPMKETISANKSARADIYHELYNRANQHSKYEVNPKEGPSIADTNPTKYKAMETMGYVQSHTDEAGKLVSHTGNVGLPGTFNPATELDPSKVLIASRGPYGDYPGLAITDLNREELEGIANGQKSLPREKEMIQKYLEQDGLEEVHTDGFAKSNLEAKRLAMKEKQIPTPLMPNAHVEPDYIGALNQANKERVPNPTRAITENIIPESNFTQRTNEIRSVINDAGSSAKSVIKEVGSHSGVKYGLAALAFAGALALTKQYTKGGGTPEQRPKGNQAPSIDGNYDSKYNKNDSNISNNTKSVRLEENGKGMTVKVRAKNRGLANDQQIQSALSDVMNSTTQTQINIRQTDDRQSLSAKSVQDMFSKALSE